MTSIFAYERDNFKFITDHQFRNQSFKVVGAGRGEPIAAWRWRKKGWLRTVNIAGRQYLTQEAIVEFHRRVIAGEFAQVHKVPSRKEATP